MVQQIGIEMHTSTENIKVLNINYKRMLEDLKKFPKEDHNFILTGYSPNLCISKIRDNTRVYYSFFDVLFVKKNK